MHGWRSECGRQGGSCLSGPALTCPRLLGGSRCRTRIPPLLPTLPTEYLVLACLPTYQFAANAALRFRHLLTWSELSEIMPAATRPPVTSRNHAASARGAIYRVGCPPWQWLVDPLSASPRPTSAASSVPPTWMPMLSCFCRSPVFLSRHQDRHSQPASCKWRFSCMYKQCNWTAPCPSFLASSPTPATLLARFSGCSKTKAVYLARF